MKRQVLAVVTCAIVIGVLTGKANAQERSTSAPADERAPRDSLELDEIIVTGVANLGTRKMDATFAITTAGKEQIAEFAPLHLGDLLNISPGVLAENTGGETGTNTFVRGFAQNSGSAWVTLQLNGLPIYPSPVAGFIENSALFRFDESIERLEALRGGSAVLLSNAQSGVTYNFLQKKGSEETEGIAKVTLTDYGLRRFDFNQSGPISERTFYSVGGFYRSSPGLRDPQYTGDYGGNAEFQITRLIEDGEVNVWARYTNDNDNWYGPIPVRIGADNKSVSEFPGFDGGSGAHHSNDNRFGVIERGNGEILSLDSKDGRDVDLVIAGMSLDRRFDNGWGVSLKAGVTDGKGGLTGPLANSNPQTLQSYMDAVVVAANASPLVVAAAGGPATQGVNPRFTGTNASITDTSIQVANVGLWWVDLEFSSFVTDFRLFKKFGNHSATVGLYTSDETYKDEWSLFNDRLMTATDNSQRIDFDLDNGVDVTRDSFVGASGFGRNIGIDSRSLAVFLLDEWQVTDRLKLEAGARYEKRDSEGSSEGINFGVDIDGNPLTLYNNSAAVLNGVFAPVTFEDDAVSWTAAANYMFADQFSMFLRASSGVRFPDPDNMVFNQRVTQAIRQYELGFKFYTEPLSVFATVFYNELDDVPFFQPVAGGISTSGSEARGLELEADLRVTDNFNVALTGTYVDSKFVDGSNNGNQLFRQPEFSFRLAPRYAFTVGDLTGAVYAAYVAYAGDRFSDNANLQPLDNYAVLNIGSNLNINSSVTVRVSVDNATDEFALTERNPRVLGGSGVSDGTTLGRPIFGRTYSISAEYRF
jgi:iron complex outermembrane receptor protein